MSSVVGEGHGDPLTAASVEICIAAEGMDTTHKYNQPITYPLITYTYPHSLLTIP